MVTAAAPYVPESLREQLAVGGRLVIPVAAGYNQDLTLIERLPNEVPPSPPGEAGAGAAGGAAAGAARRARYRETSILGCTFVPLIGQQGYRE